MSTKTSTASESASKRRTKAASSSAPEAAAVQVAPVAAPAAPVAAVLTAAPAAPESKGSKRKSPEKETKEPVAKETKRSGAGSGKAAKTADNAAKIEAAAAPTATAAAPATPATEGTSEPPAKKPRKAPAPKAEGEAKSSSRKKKAAASEASPDAAAVAETKAKEEEDCVEDGNPCIGRYLRALLKREYADSTISKDAIYQVQRYVYQFGLHFLVAVKRHLESAKKNTLMMHDMPTCLQRSLSRSSLYQDFSNAMSAALTLYYASYQNAEQAPAADTAADASIEEKRKQMWAARAGLSIPPTRTKEFAKKYLAKFRFSQNSITGLTALFEVLAQRIFKLSYEKAQEVSRKRISQLDVQTALKGDNELSWLLIEPVVPLV